MAYAREQIQDARAEFRPGDAQALPFCRPERIERLLREAGLAQAGVRAIDAPTVFRDFDDSWSPFLGGQGPAPSYAMSLSENRRAALRERIRAN